MRPDDDDEDQDWWFASTAIPLLAATMGPLANVMSIAALVTPWRNNYAAGNLGVDELSMGFDDPTWVLGLNGASLACGFIGNLFLLLNFTKRVRYILALPMTIILWYLATGIVSSYLSPPLVPSCLFHLIKPQPTPTHAEKRAMLCQRNSECLLPRSFAQNRCNSHSWLAFPLCSIVESQDILEQLQHLRFTVAHGPHNFDEHIFSAAYARSTL